MKCKACDGKGYIIVQDTLEHAHSEKCPVCGGSGEVDIIPPPNPYICPQIWWYVPSKVWINTNSTQVYW